MHVNKSVLLKSLLTNIIKFCIVNITNKPLL